MNRPDGCDTPEPGAVARMATPPKNMSTVKLQPLDWRIADAALNYLRGVLVQAGQSEHDVAPEAWESRRHALAQVVHEFLWPEGSFDIHSVQRAFVDGAKWWQFHANGATAWSSEVRDMETEAIRRYGDHDPS